MELKVALLLGFLNSRSTRIPFLFHDMIISLLSRNQLIEAESDCNYDPP